MAFMKCALFALLGVLVALPEPSHCSNRTQEVVAVLREGIKALDPLLTQVEGLVLTVKDIVSNGSKAAAASTYNVERATVLLLQVIGRQYTLVADVPQDAPGVITRCYTIASASIVDVTNKVIPWYLQCDINSSQRLSTILNPFSTYVNDVLNTISATAVVPTYACVSDPDNIRPCIDRVIEDSYKKISEERARLEGIRSQVTLIENEYAECKSNASRSAVALADGVLSRLDSCIPKIRRAA